MSDTEILSLLNNILKELKNSNEIQQNILNLFKQYDTEELLLDEELRNLQQG